MLRSLSIRLALCAVPVGVAFAAGPATAGAAAPVPCTNVGGGHYNCTFYVPGDGHSGGSPVVNSGGATVGYLHKGVNWVICQQQGGRVTKGAYYNSWWAWTLSDVNTWGWVNAVNASGGDNDGLYGGGVPNCNGGHGAPPGAGGSGPPPPPPPPPGPSPTARQAAISSGISWALSKVGTRMCTGEQPAWNRAFGLRCTDPWCGVFTFTAMDHGGFALNKARMAYTENIYTDALTGANGLSVIPKGSAQPGDMVLYKYVTTRSRRVSHVGIVTSAVNGGRFTTVEGNTGSNSVVGTHNVSIGDSHLVAIVRAANIKGQPAGFRQYAASNARKRRKLNKKYGLHGKRLVEVGPGQKDPYKKHHRK